MQASTSVRFLAVALILATLPATASAQDTFENVPRVVAVGDVHGGYQEFLGVLRTAGLIDASNRWVGGKAHLVQTGDVVDRGPDSRKALDLLMSLEKQAKAAGGRVHALLGNHEVMNMLGDLRYVSEAEFRAFQTIESDHLRNRAYRRLADPARRDDGAYRRDWEAKHPLGWVEHRLAFGPTGTYGRWLREHNTIVRVNGMLFVHGGISPKYLALSLREINDRVRAELDDPSAAARGLTTDSDGPFWYRGLALLTETDVTEHLSGLLSRHEARLIAVGHTRVAPVILPRASGRIVLLDVGLSAYYGGPQGCLVAEQGKLFAIHRGERLELPQRDGLLAYLRAAADLDPQPSPLRTLIEEIAADPAGGVR